MEHIHGNLNVISVLYSPPLQVNCQMKGMNIFTDILKQQNLFVELKWLQ